LELPGQLQLPFRFSPGGPFLQLLAEALEVLAQELHRGIRRRFGGEKVREVQGKDRKKNGDGQKSRQKGKQRKLGPAEKRGGIGGGKRRGRVLDDRIGVRAFFRRRIQLEGGAGKLAVAQDFVRADQEAPHVQPRKHRGGRPRGRPRGQAKRRERGRGKRDADEIRDKRVEQRGRKAVESPPRKTDKEEVHPRPARKPFCEKTKDVALIRHGSLPGSFQRGPSRLGVTPRRAARTGPAAG
jgi:hypothetical protein